MDVLAEVYGLSAVHANRLLQKLNLLTWRKVLLHDGELRVAVDAEDLAFRVLCICFLGLSRTLRQVISVACLQRLASQQLHVGRAIFEQLEWILHLLYDLL